MIAKVAFKMFLGISADITSWNADSTAFSLLLYENPLSGAWFAKGFLKALLTPQSSAECVELPPQHSQLLYSNVLCGVIRGALEMVRKRARARARLTGHLFRLRSRAGADRSNCGWSAGSCATYSGETMSTRSGACVLFCLRVQDFSRARCACNRAPCSIELKEVLEDEMSSEYAES